MNFKLFFSRYELHTHSLLWYLFSFFFSCILMLFIWNANHMHVHTFEKILIEEKTNRCFGISSVFFFKCKDKSYCKLVVYSKRYSRREKKKNWLNSECCIQKQWIWFRKEKSTTIVERPNSSSSSSKRVWELLFKQKWALRQTLCSFACTTTFDIEREGTCGLHR